VGMSFAIDMRSLLCSQISILSLVSALSVLVYMKTRHFWFALGHVYISLCVVSYTELCYFQITYKFPPADESLGVLLPGDI
jgi:hypothetical protein